MFIFQTKCFLLVIRTHKNVLAAVSDYFRAMLTGSMIEARQDHVDLKGVTSHVVKILLHFAYTG